MSILQGIPLCNDFIQYCLLTCKCAFVTQGSQIKTMYARMLDDRHELLMKRVAERRPPPLSQWDPMWIRLQKWEHVLYQGRLGKGKIKLAPSQPIAERSDEASHIWGTGLWAERDIKAGEWITFYDGVHLTFDDALHLKHQGKWGHIRKITAMHLSIDGYADPHFAIKEMRGAAQFANDWHSSGFSKNCSLSNTMTSPKALHTHEMVLLIAVRDIIAGSELWTDYGRGYWKLYKDFPPASPSQESPTQVEV
jgi:hypothetical protein